jgi:acetyltransferase-like isoleucine patch superfamily enzyme
MIQDSPSLNSKVQTLSDNSQFAIRDSRFTSAGRNGHLASVVRRPSLRFVWQKLRRSYFTRRAARALGCSPAQLDVSGPCVIHGGGRFVIGKNVALRATPRLPIELYCAPGATITLADNCFLNQGVQIACRKEVSIGEQCLIADQAMIMDTDFHSVADEAVQTAPVVIERGAWVAARAIILKGVTIGESAIVGAGAVVARSIPARTVAVGNPARVVRRF